MKHLMLTCLALTFTCAPAFAEDTKLTEQSIRAYYDETAQINKKSFKEYTAFMDKHTSADVKITLESKVTVDGSPTPEQDAVSLDKKKLMSGLQEEFDAAQKADIQHSIKGIKISPDGKSATVVDLSTIDGEMTSKTDAGPVKLHVKSQSACEDQLILGAGSVVQLTKSTCKTNTQIKPL